MIHTIQLYTILWLEDIKKLEKMNARDIIDILKGIEAQFQGVTINLQKTGFESKYKVYLLIDVIELLGKEDGIVREYDYEECEQQIQEISKLLTPYDRDKVIFELLRIEYRFDTYISEKEDREFLFKIYNKLVERYFTLKKCNRPKKKLSSTEDKLEEICNEEYRTTLYYNSKSVGVIVYDKEEERKAKNEICKPYEANVLRFEVKLFNAHLKNMKYTGKRDKVLSEYFREEVYKQYIDKYICRLFGEGDFYKIYYVKKKLEASNLSQKEKDRIKEFIKEISNHGVEAVVKWRDGEDKAKKLYSRYYMKKYMDMLNALDINMILIPQNAKASSHIKNPLKQLNR